MKELISVIVPIYNSEKYIDRCLSSITKQTYKNLEIILINDGSNDNSGIICEKWKKKDNRIIVIHKQNTGVSDTRNLGIEISKGDYITFVDCDDYIDNTMIEKLYKSIINENADIAICGFKRVLESGKVTFESKLKNECLYGKDSYIEELLRERYFIGSLWAKLYNKKVFGKVKLNKSLRIAEDLDFLLNISDNIKKIILVSDNLYFYVFNKNSATKNSDFEKYSDELKVLERILDKKSKFYNLVLSRYLRININMFYRFRTIEKDKANYCKHNIKTVSFKIGFSKYFKIKQKIKFLLVKLNLVR